MCCLFFSDKVMLLLCREGSTLKTILSGAFKDAPTCRDIKLAKAESGKLLYIHISITFVHISLYWLTLSVPAVHLNRSGLTKTSGNYSSFCWENVKQFFFELLLPLPMFTAAIHGLSLKSRSSTISFSVQFSNWRCNLWKKQSLFVTDSFLGLIPNSINSNTG